MDSFFSADDLWRAEGRSLTGLGRSRYRLTALYFFFEKGLLSTDSQQIPVAELHDIDVRQSMSQKARGVGTISLTVIRPSTAEIVRIEDIPNFREGQQALNAAAHEARVRAQKLQASITNTHRTENVSVHRIEGASPSGFVPPGVPSLTHGDRPEITSEGPALDPVDQLRRLGELRDAGIVTPQEFEAKKQEMLRRL